MKNMVKKNQIMITALAIMIAVAGYLNFAGSKITEEEIMTAGSGTVMSEDVADSDVAALFEISDEDMEQADIQSMDSDVVLNESNYLDENMEEIMAENMTGEMAQNTENQLSDGENAGRGSIYFGCKPGYPFRGQTVKGTDQGKE